MDIQRFLKHWKLVEHPFAAEEARDDAVFERLMAQPVSHPDFNRVLGRLDHPSSAVVFGEKGSGKTAFKRLIEHRLKVHNQQSPDNQLWIVRYDDMNPILDRLLRRSMAQGKNNAMQVRVADHLDAILSRAMTDLGDELLDPKMERSQGQGTLRQRIRKLPRGDRDSFASLLAIYDEPTQSDDSQRWSSLRRAIRWRWINWPSVALWVGVAAAVGLLLEWLLIQWSTDATTWQLWLVMIITGLLAAGLLSMSAVRWITFWRRARKIRRQVRISDMPGSVLRRRLWDLPRGSFNQLHWPDASHPESRYAAMASLRRILNRAGFAGIVVLVDRIDEPAMVNGDPAKMKAIVWPMFNNKFLQQDGIGFKLLLPIELLHELRRESAYFFQQARMDKQNMIERLNWSGATLYDLCNARLRACRQTSSEAVDLKQMFDEDVSGQLLIDALGQMRQPRDAFKLMYQVWHAHCQLVADDEPRWRVARLTLEQVLQDQSRRLNDFQRGLSPS